MSILFLNYEIWSNDSSFTYYELFHIKGIIMYMWKHFLLINKMGAGLAEFIYKHLPQLYMSYVCALSCIIIYILE